MFHSVAGLGFLLSSISKHANHGNNPGNAICTAIMSVFVLSDGFIVWPIVDERSGGYNKLGITLALLAITNFYTRSSSPVREVAKKTDKKSNAKSGTTPTPTRANWVFDGIALGTLIFTLHCFISDGSTLIAWSWTGYPVKGPLPHLHGSLTHVAQAAGLLLPTIFGSCSSSIFASPLWFLYGAGSAYVTYAYKDWTGYIGGMNFAVFLMSIIPVVFGRADSSKYLVRTYTLAFFVNALWDVINTFTVAYAFVPGGEYFRERTDMYVYSHSSSLQMF